MILEKRMYFLTPYQLIGMQKGIQSLHAALEYVMRFKDSKDADILWEFIRDWKTVIVLNGGTTNDGHEVYDAKTQTMVPYFGTMQQDLKLLHEHAISHTVFREPDLNNSILSICLIADERVFNKKDYPDFYFPTYKTWLDCPGITDTVLDRDKYNKLKDQEYVQYVKKVGSDIACLKQILNTKEKASN